ncbi:MAG TPA: TIGR03118 family protein [Candidatus Acidoferrum sp.]
MKRRVAVYFIAFFLLGFLLVADIVTAQTIAYRQANLASNLSDVANNVTPSLADPWGIAFLPGQPFFLADNNAARATAHDASGLSVRPGSFTLPNSSGTGFDTPTGIVADQNSFFGSASLVKPFILVTDQGTIFAWGPDPQGDLPQNATLEVNNTARSAVYKGVAILNSSLTQPALAVTDFHGGFIDTFIPGFAPVALPGSFTDPNLPLQFAPFGIQVIGRQVFVTYAVQDAAKHDPVIGAGNGIVSIFDMDGNFVRRFATGGVLNAPWGIAQASANFGPFSNDILIGNMGDGTINAFDPTTGRLVGKLTDGDGKDITDAGLHGLAFRPDGFADPNVLFFASEFSSVRDGLFGAITTGLVSVTRVSAPEPNVNESITITANIAPGPGNVGGLTGIVTFLDGSTHLGTAPLANGSAAMNATFAGAGIHNVTALYSGNTTFLPSSESIPLQVTALVTRSALVAPATAAPGSAITLTATVSSVGGVPTGSVIFLDGTTQIGTSLLDDTGAATLRNNTLATGTHSLTSSYAGDGKFAASTSAAVSVVIANADFSLGATPSTASVIAGRSTQFTLSVVPSGGFANSISFSCTPVAGVTCSFNPAAVTPANGAASTVLTVTTSANALHFGFLIPELIAPLTVLAAMALFSLAMWRSRILPGLRRPQFAVVVAAIVILGLAVGGCGGPASSSQVNRGTVTINVVAQSGAISHTTTVSVTVQ